jgi:hypothetical protein
MVRLYRHRYSGIKYLNGPAIPAPLFRHKMSQWSGYTGTAIQAQNVSMVLLYRHCFSGTKCLNGPAIPALLFRHKMSRWSGYTDTAFQAQNVSMVRLYRHCYSGTKCLDGPAIPTPLFKHKMSRWSFLQNFITLFTKTAVSVRLSVPAGFPASRHFVSVARSWAGLSAIGKNIPLIQFFFNSTTFPLFHVIFLILISKTKTQFYSNFNNFMVFVPLFGNTAFCTVCLNAL